MIEHDAPSIDELPKVKIISIGNDATDIVQHIYSLELKSMKFIAISSNPCTSRDDILASLKGCDMAFIITADNTTDVSTAVTVAECTRDVGALTLGVVLEPSIPFELTDRQSNHIKEIEEFKEKVDAIFEIIKDKDELYPLIKSIFDLIAAPGLINLDFADLKYIFSGVGYADMGFGMSSGEDMYTDAYTAALQQSMYITLFEIEKAGSILINISGSENRLNMLSVNDTVDIIREIAHPDANIIFGATIDNTLSNNIRVTVIITRLGALKKDEADKPADPIGIPVLCRDKKIGKLYEEIIYPD